MNRVIRLAFGVLTAGFGVVWTALGQAQLPENFSVAQPKIPQHTINVMDFGAVADGKTPDTEAFKKALAAVEAAGGGVLDVPAGTYLTGPLQLVSDLELRVETGATIKFSDNRADYKLTEGGYEICMHADDAHDIAIT